MNTEKDLKLSGEKDAELQNAPKELSEDDLTGASGGVAAWQGKDMIFGSEVSSGAYTGDRILHKH